MSLIVGRVILISIPVSKNASDTAENAGIVSTSTPVSTLVRCDLAAAKRYPATSHLA